MPGVPARAACPLTHLPTLPLIVQFSVVPGQYLCSAELFCTPNKPHLASGGPPTLFYRHPGCHPTPAATLPGAREGPAAPRPARSSSSRPAAGCLSCLRWLSKLCLHAAPGVLQQGECPREACPPPTRPTPPDPAGRPGGSLGCRHPTLSPGNYYPLQLGLWFGNAKCGGGQSQDRPETGGARQEAGPRMPSDIKFQPGIVDMNFLGLEGARGRPGKRGGGLRASVSAQPPAETDADKMGGPDKFRCVPWLKAPARISTALSPLDTLLPFAAPGTPQGAPRTLLPCRAAMPSCHATKRVAMPPWAEKWACRTVISLPTGGCRNGHGPR